MLLLARLVLLFFFCSFFTCSPLRPPSCFFLLFCHLFVCLHNFPGDRAQIRQPPSEDLNRRQLECIHKYGRKFPGKFCNLDVFRETLQPDFNSKEEHLSPFAVYECVCVCVSTCVRLNEHWCVCVRVFYMCLKTPFTHHYIPHRGKLKTSKSHQNAQMKHFMCGGGISLGDKFHFRLEMKPAVSLREQAAVTARRFPQVSPATFSN